MEARLVHNKAQSSDGISMSIGPAVPRGVIKTRGYVSNQGLQKSIMGGVAARSSQLVPCLGSRTYLKVDIELGDSTGYPLWACARGHFQAVEA